MLCAIHEPEKGENLIATQSQVSPQARTTAVPADLGAKVVALAGVGLVDYGIMCLIRDFTGFIELGRTPAHVGATPEQIQAFSSDLYEYISHLYGIGAFGHLGLIYLDALILLIGTILSYNALKLS